MKTCNVVMPKLVSTVLFISLVIALIAILKNPIHGSELSIYSSLFPLNIFFLILPVMGGIGLVIQGLYKQNHNWQIGLLLIVLTGLIIALLPYLKGYQFSDGGDQLTHFGFTKDILNTGHISGYDIYPVTHCLIAPLAMISKIQPEILINFIGPLFYLMFILFTFLFSREVLPKPAAILATVCSTVLSCYYYTELFPMGFALAFFPLIFYLFFSNLRKREPVSTLLLIALVILMTFFHPVTSLLLTVALLLMECGNLIYTRFISSPKESDVFSPNIPMISFYCLVLWIWYRFNVWNDAVSNIASWFNSQLFVQPMTAIAEDSFSKLGLDTFQRMMIIAQTYGHILIFLFLSVIAVLLIIRNKMMLEKEPRRNITAYSIFFLPALAIWLVDYIRPLSQLSSGRMIWVVITLFPMLTGYTLYRLGGKTLDGNRHPGKSYFNGIRSASIGLIIVVCSLFGIFSYYPSPIIYQPYGGISHSDFAGESWLVLNGNLQMGVLRLYTPPTERIADALWDLRKNIFPELIQPLSNTILAILIIRPTDNPSPWINIYS